ncbi:MAG: metallophosphoesterase [Deinococcus sp.]|nr:metallophosphoesterase [Deinococcus sp.]
MPRQVRLYAVGDVHGYCDGLIEALDQAGILDQQGNLLEEVRIVQVGDIYDRGPDCGRVVAYLDQQGDRVVRLLGNHELEYLHPRSCGLLSDEQFQRIIHSGHPAARYFAQFSDFSAARRQDLLERLATGKLLAAYASGGVLFIHAALLVRDLETLELEADASPEAMANCINRLARTAAIMARAGDFSGFEHPLFAEDGPFWRRPWNFQLPELIPGLRQIAGHTPPGRGERHIRVIKGPKGASLTIVDVGIMLGNREIQLVGEID